MEMFVGGKRALVFFLFFISSLARVRGVCETVKAKRTRNGEENSREKRAGNVISLNYSGQSQKATTKRIERRANEQEKL